jgi:proteasome beta subunit
MTGDFLGLLQRSSAPTVNTGGQSPLGLEATTVFAFHCAEGVIIGGDHRATAGHTIFSDKTEKILELDSHSLMAIAGVPAMAFEMARTLQTAFEFYRRSQLQAMSLPAKIRALSRLLRENLPATLQGVGAVSPVFVGVEIAEPAVRPVIFFYDPLGAHFEAAVAPLLRPASISTETFPGLAAYTRMQPKFIIYYA